MNTIRSVGYGWGVLIVAGFGSYYVAKQGVIADRAERAEDSERRRQHRERMRVQEALSREAAMNNGSIGTRAKPSRTAPPEGSPSAQASPAEQDPTPSARENDVPRSKYEAADPFRSRKGDRFS